MLKPISFGTWLRQKRRALDLTQKALADQVGCAEITVRRMEADEYKPSHELALLLLEKLGIPEPERPQWVRFARGLAEHPNHYVNTSLSGEQKTNLPIPLTSFIGREKEIETVKRLITSHDAGRLITLTGAGGSGKTRLALQVAYATLDVFPDGVWFIEFAPLSDPALVPQSLLTTLGLSEQAGCPTISMVSDFLQRKRALLILDNCEHLIQACAQLADTLLRACPTLHLLTTSREALGVAGERLYLVPTLATPDPAQADLNTIPQFEAVRLFVERAQTAWSGFALTDDNTPAVARVCHQLDGIPLALELAAARVKALRVEQISARLAAHEQFHLLTTGIRTALPRHQTLHALIDWSYNLLSEEERLFLQRLSVFAGGCTLEAAEAVCVGEGVEADDVLDLITQLVTKSLVISERERGREARYRMLETIRQYASGRLLKAGEAEQLRNRHLDFFLDWAEQAGAQLRGAKQLEWLDRLEAENDNLRAALEWSLAQAESSEVSLHLAGALFMFWYRRGSINEGRAWLARALARPAAPLTGAARAQALYADGFLAHGQSDTTAQAVLKESISLWRALGPPGKTGLAYALAELGEELRWRGDPATARALAEEAIALFREQDERWGLAYSLSGMGLAIRDLDDFALARSVINESVALWRDLGGLWELGESTRFLGLVSLRQGDYEAALRHFGDFLAITRRLGNEVAVAWALLDLGEATLNLGDRAQAQSLIEESFRILRDFDSKYGIALCLYFFGLIAGLENDSEQAAIFFEQCLALAHTTGPIWYRADALMGLAGVAAAGGQALRAARLLGAADTQIEAGASYWNAAESLYIGHTITSAVAQLGEAAFAEARAEGQAMTFEQAASYALESEPFT
jgi:predicted ATPase/DNA-binding XRE family transcriptional regulator